MKVIKANNFQEDVEGGYTIEELSSVPSGKSSSKSSSRREASGNDTLPPSVKIPPSESKVLSSLQRQCSKREYCRSDVFKKAKKAMDGDSAAASRIVDSLVKDRYVDDLRYAGAFAREKASLSGWGKVKISYMLSAKGIDRSVISQALEEIDDASSEKKMESVIRAKFRTLAGEKDAYLKLMRFALSRGYAYDEVKSIVDTVIREYREENPDSEIQEW